MVRDAAAAGKKYAFRHYKLAAFEDTTREQALEIAAAIAQEFGFDLGRGILIEHEKERVGGEACGQHWHLLVPEWDPVRHRVLDASWMRPRQEKLSRLAEIRLGHSPVVGRWNAAVERRLGEEGRGHDADRVAPLADVPRPQSAYTAVRHQAAACGGPWPTCSSAPTNAPCPSLHRRPCRCRRPHDRRAEAQGPQAQQCPRHGSPGILLSHDQAVRPQPRDDAHSRRQDRPRGKALHAPRSGAGTSAAVGGGATAGVVVDAFWRDASRQQRVAL